MKKTTKFFASIAATALVAGSVMPMASCAGDTVSGINSGNVNVVAYDGNAVTISFYHSMGAGLKGVLDTCIKDFNKIYPNITVQHTSFGDYNGVRDQITTELSAGRGPSLAYCYPDHVALYNKSKAILTLDGYIESDLRIASTNEQVGLTQEQINDYVPLYYNEGKMYGDDKMYTLPMMKSTELLYYNATYFMEHELKVPTTWDEMEATCKKIVEIESAKEGGLASNPCFPLGYDSGANWFITMTEQLNSGYTTSEKGNYYTFNNETNRKFVERFRGWYEKGYVTTKEIFGTYTSKLFTQTTKSKPKAFMCIGSSAGAPNQIPKPVSGKVPFEVGVAMIPQENPEDPTMISQGPSLCLFKKQNEQEIAAAWLFAKYITTTVKHQANFSMLNGYTCAIQSVAADEVYSGEEFLANVIDATPVLENKELGIIAYGNDNLQAACVKLTMDFKENYYVSPAFVGSSQARDEMALLMKNCFQQKPTGNQTSSDLIKSFFDSTYNTLKSKYDK